MVVTVTSNGRLMKPQFLNEENKLQDWTSSNTTIGSSNKKDLTFSHNYVENKDEIPTVIERYDMTDDWAEKLVPVRNDKENKE